MTTETEKTLGIIYEKYGINPEGAVNPIRLPISRHAGFIELLKELGFGTGAEVGVETGSYSEQLCRGIPGLKLYCVDAWTSYEGYRDYVGQDNLDGFYETAKLRLAPYDATLIKGWSVDVARQFEDGSLDFVYIDANHTFEFVTADIAVWRKKVRPGGILAGHDFRRSRHNCHVKDVVQGWTYSHGISPWFIAGRDKSPSWMWVC